MKTEEEILKYWGDDLVTVPLELLSQVRLNEEAKIFLSTIGLPVRDGLLIDFKINPDDLKVFNYKNSRHIVLADDYGMKTCIQEETGEIFLIDTRGEYPTTFINSDVKSLVIFMQIFENFYPIIVKVPVDESEGIIQELKQEFLNVDPNALINDENWWVVILEQLQDGLL